MKAWTLALAVLLTGIVGCSRSEKALDINVELNGESNRLLVTGLSDSEKFKAQAKARGLKVTGNAVVLLEGSESALRSLRVPVRDEILVALDEEILMLAPEKDLTPPDETIYYLAKRDFGLPEFWQEHPEYDGRGVIVGVIDDGASPLASGLKTTSDGQRKFLYKHTTADVLKFSMNLIEDGEERPEIIGSIKHTFDRVWHKSFTEEELSGFAFGIFTTDLNANDSLIDEYDLVATSTNGTIRICLDSNVNKTFDDPECFGQFSETGESGFWTEDQLVSVQAEFDLDFNELVLTRGERTNDSHGEGVASVLVGHGIAGRFDGVAPGAQLVDYDFSEPTRDIDQAIYSMGRFTQALEFLGEKGVSVANVSYSLFFSSVASQIFLQKAVEKIVEEYNMVVSWSAGNNGPGFGSLNRRMLYPENNLVAGAFVSKDLDEYVHGVTGLPEQGRVVWYSSRGPGPSFGRGPTVISPLASLSHSNPSDGYRAFSGTSSASPALAGLATVLVSAAKQSELVVDASAIVHAIRMSAEPLEGVSFVDQGYGMPNAARAFAIYETLVSGEQFTNVKAKVLGQTARGGADAQGLQLRSTDNVDEYRVEFKASVAKKAPAGTPGSLLRPITLEYSENWLQGPERLFLSVGKSHISLSVDPSQLNLVAGLDYVATVKLRDSETGLLLHTLPVSILNPIRLDESAEVTYTLGAEEGKRLHLDIPAGVQAYNIEVINRAPESASFYARPYNNSRVLSGGILRLWEHPTFFVKVDRPGLQQVGLARSKGTALAGEVSLRLHPVRMDLRTNAVGSNNGQIHIYNSGAAMNAKVTLTSAKKKILSEAVVVGQMNRIVQKEISITETGSYSAKLLPVNHEEMEMFVAYCFVSYLDGDEIVNRESASEFDVEVLAGGEGEEPQPTRILIECGAFDRTHDQMQDLPLRLEVHKRGVDERATKYVRLKGGMNTVDISDTDFTLDEKFEVKVAPAFGAGSIELGELEIF